MQLPPEDNPGRIKAPSVYGDVIYQKDVLQGLPRIDGLDRCLIDCRNIPTSDSIKLFPVKPAGISQYALWRITESGQQSCPESLYTLQAGYTLLQKEVICCELPLFSTPS